MMAPAEVSFMRNWGLALALAISVPMSGCVQTR
jgi:hypothetical protein